MRTLWRCVASSLLAAAAVVVAVSVTHGAGPVVTTSMAVSVAPRVELGSPTRIEATLRDQAGKPVGGAVVRLYTSATFLFTESGAIEIGKEITGPDGVAIFEYVPSRNVTTEVRAEYQGDDSYGPSHSTASFEVYGDRQLIQTHAGIQVSFINKWLLGGILIIIWSLYLFVVSRILRIAQAPLE